jgi:GeoRSP system PqqD family protein
MTKYFRNPDALWREEDLPTEQAIKGLEMGEDVAEVGTSIILSHGKMHALNILGTEVWKLCDGRTVDQIVTALRDRFDVEPDVLKTDVESFLKEMKELGLVDEA